MPSRRSLIAPFIFYHYQTPLSHWILFIQSAHQYLLRAHSVLGSLLGAGNTQMNKAQPLSLTLLRSDAAHRDPWKPILRWRSECRRSVRELWGQIPVEGQEGNRTGHGEKSSCDAASVEAAATLQRVLKLGLLQTWTQWKGWAFPLQCGLVTEGWPPWKRDVTRLRQLFTAVSWQMRLRFLWHFRHLKEYALYFWRRISVLCSRERRDR